MIQLRLLGPLVLIDADRHEVASLLPQTRRLALLAYLAAVPPGRFHRRDALLALFWPELDQEHARAALRQALHVLRGALGPGVVATRGDEEIGLDDRGISCDVPAFDDDVAAGRLDEALERYRGHFLEGFFITGAPEFERWVDEERTRLRRSACQAAGMLAERCRAGGELPRAADFARRATLLDPDDEMSARRLVSLLDAQGERAGAIQVYDAFAQRLAQEYEAEPSAETRALIAAVRSRPARAALPESEAGHPANPAKPAPAPIVEPTVATPAPRSAWAVLHQPGPAALIAGVLVLSLAGAALAIRHGTPVRLDPHRVVTAAFDNRTGDSTLNVLGTMAADWISRGLEGTGIVDVADPALIRVEAGPSPGMRVLAERAGAGIVVSGAFYRQGDSIRFEARVTDARQDRLLRSVTPVTGVAADPRAGVEALRQHVTAALATVLDPRLSDWATLASQPPSYETYQEFVAGYEAFFRLEAREALQHLYRAAAMDSTFKLPLVWATLAHSFLDECDRADSLARVLAPARERLARLDRFLLDHQMAMCRGDVNAPYRMARQMVQEVPQSEFLALTLGRDALALNRPAEARAVLERLHPDRGVVLSFPPYFLYLSCALHQLGDYDRELAVARAGRRQHPNNLAMLRLELLALAALGRTGEVFERVDEIPTFPPHPLRSPSEVMRDAALELRAHGQRAAGDSLLARALAWFDTRPAAELATDASRLERLETIYAAGRWQVARPLAEQLALEQPTNLTYQGLRGVLAAWAGDRRQAGWSDSVLAARPPDPDGLSTYWRACIAARLGNSSQAVSLLWQAHAEGWGSGGDFFRALHTDPALEPLHDYAPFLALQRPKG
jgi:DNA-binding SARP family transcriptional activator/tetratricopeptide (TPR) repeat protein